jgi:glycosyltransferase involved in cell wall biosynthesis
MERPDVSVVVVTWNARTHVERCLESVRGRDVIVVDNGSTDGTVALVRERFPEVRVVEQANVGMGGGNNAGMRHADGRYFFLLNSDAWVEGDGLDALLAFADAHPDAAVVGPRLANPDGTLQRSVRGEPTLWRLATEYFFIRKLAPRTNLLNPLYAGGFAHDAPRAVDWLSGAALLHEVGAYVNRTGWHRHAYYLIANSEILGYTPAQRRVMAAISRYLGSALPSSGDKLIKSLEPQYRAHVPKAVALLRLARALNQGRSRAVASVAARAREDEITLQLKPRHGQHADLEMWALKKERAYFRAVFGRELEAEL